MTYFDKRMALDVVEDALTDMDSPLGSGMAIGLCGAFYMLGLFSEREWNAFLERIPADAGETSVNKTHCSDSSSARACSRILH